MPQAAERTAMDILALIRGEEVNGLMSLESTLDQIAEELPAALAGGGGVALPLNLGPGLFAVDADGVTEISPDDASGDDILIIRAPAGYHLGSGDGWMLRLVGPDGADVLTIDPSATLTIQPQEDEGTQGAIVVNSYDAADQTKIQAGGTAWPILVEVGGDRRFRVMRSGGIIVAGSVPNGADVAAGEVQISYDETNGAGRLVFTGKTTNGTAVTGEIPLSP